CGVTIRPLAPRDEPPDGAFDAILCDWDYWPADRHGEVLAGLGAAPVAVHSYRLDEDQSEALRSKGVAVFRRLDVEVLHTLKQAICQVREAVRPAAREEEFAPVPRQGIRDLSGNFARS